MRSNLKYRFQVLRQLMPHLFGVRKFVVFFLLVCVASAVTEFLPPLVYRIFIDDVVVGGDFDLFFTTVVTGYLAIQLMKAGFSYLSMYCNNRMSYHLLFKIKNKIFGTPVREEAGDTTTESVGKMKMNIEDDTAFLREFIEKHVVHYVLAAASAAGACILLFTVFWKLALVAAVSIPLTIRFDLFVSNKEKRVVELNRENDEQMTSWFHASLGGWKEIKALNLEKHEKKKYVGFLNKFAKYHTLTINYFVIRYLVMPWVKEKFVMHLLLYFIGGLFVIRQELTIGMLFMFVQYNKILSDSANKVSSTDGDLRSQKPIIDRVLHILAREPQKPKPKLKESLTDIVMQRVTYRHPDHDKPVLSDVSLSISRGGDRVIIYGRSGAGKSTLAKLLTGLLEPAEGEIYMSGRNLKHLNKRFLYKKIGYIRQDSTLFNMTIREFFC